MSELLEKDKKQISTAKPTLLRSSDRTGLVQPIIYDQAGVVSLFWQPEMPVSQLQGKIEFKLKRQSHQDAEIQVFMVWRPPYIDYITSTLPHIDISK